jgi:hypothetical protein
MVTSLRASTKRQVLSIAALNLLGLSLAAHSALADNATRGPAQESGARSAEISSERSGSAKAPVRKPTRKRPDRSGNFVYEIINQIRAQSEELCARYGSPGDCLEEAEVCLTMRDFEDNQVRLCLNTVPGEDGGNRGAVQKSRLRR